MQQLNRRQRRQLERQLKHEINVNGRIRLIHSYQIIDRDGRDVTKERMRDAPEQRTG